MLTAPTSIWLGNGYAPERYQTAVASQIVIVKGTLISCITNQARDAADILARDNGGFHQVDTTRSISKQGLSSCS